MKKFLSAILISYAITGFAAAPMPMENINRTQNVKFSADSSYYNYTPEKVADCNRKDQPSRWVSDASSHEHWLMAEYQKPQTVNTVVIHFWTDNHISQKFDLQGRINGQWVTLKEISNNNTVNPEIVFPSCELSAIRLNFHRQTPDGMVRIYEFEAGAKPYAIEAVMTDGVGRNLLAPGDNKSIVIHNYEPNPVTMTIETELLPIKGSQQSKTVRQTVKIDRELTLRVPTPDEFGIFQYNLNAVLPDNSRVVLATETVLYFPPAEPVYKNTSPFGSHFYHFHPSLVEHAGIYWWRNHDMYGRWNENMSEDGIADWSDIDKRFEDVKKYNIRECAVLLGAPRKYSTILPGEEVTSGADSIYSYYPPSDIDAWKKLYVAPLAGKLQQVSPFRAYEMWNEAWSYYRLRGLHGTPGEAALLFKETYELLKQIDPEAMVYPTDIGALMIDNPYTFKNFGRDMFELGFLRWADLFSFHSYADMDFKLLETYRRNMWNYARDFEMWSTETATEGKPFYRFMRSMLNHRIWGNGKTFIYNGNLWAPLYLDGKPHLNLAAYSAMIRELGDALPLGWQEKDGITAFLFANGNTPVAVLFTESENPLKINIATTENSRVTDIFGNQTDPEKPVLAVDNPVFVANPANEAVQELFAARMDFLAQHAYSQRDFAAKTATLIRSVTFDKLPEAVVQAIRQLDEIRPDLQGDELYDSNMVLEQLTNMEIFFTRAKLLPQFNKVNIATPEKIYPEAWNSVYSLTGHNGVMPDTERLLSRSQKLSQQANAYMPDGDSQAAAILAIRAEQDLQNAYQRMEKEEILPVYKTKTYFRSHKRFIRSELYCFPAGKPQEAVISLANPTGKPLEGKIKLQLPEGWTVATDTIDCVVAPLSRQNISVNITAPAKLDEKFRGKIIIHDMNGNFPEISAECQIVEKTPPFPVLGGAMSTGMFTGN